MGWIENPLMNDQSSALWEDFNVFGQPLGMIARTAPASGSLLVTHGQWEGRIQSETTKPYYAHLETKNVEFDDQARTINFNAEVIFDEIPLDGGPYRLSAIILEDSVTGVRQHNYYNDVVGHPHEGLGDIIWNYTHRNVTRAILDDHWGTASVVPDIPNIGESYTQSYSYILPEEYDENQISIILLLTQHVEGDLQKRKVFNASKVNLTDVVEVISSSNEVLKEEYGVVIYPNPVQNVLNATLDKLPESVRIINLKGQEVINNPEVSQTLNVDVSALHSGQYYLLLKYENESVIQAFSKH